MTPGEKGRLLAQAKLAGNFDQVSAELTQQEHLANAGLDLRDDSPDERSEEQILLEQSRAALARRDAARAVALEGQGANEAYGELGTMGSASQPAGAGSPGGSLAEQELLAKAKAAQELGKAQVTGQTPAQAAAAAQAALQASLANPGGARVIGMTKGGFQPSQRSSQSQRERTELPPGYTEVASEELRQNRIQGEEMNEQALLADALAVKNAKVRSKIAEIQQFAQEKAMDEEERALQGAQDQIASAISEFKKGGPKLITYRDIWDSQDGGGKVTLALSFIAGAFGSVGGGPNGATKALDNFIERKIDIQQRESERQGKAIGDAQNAYEALHQRFRDKETTRKALRLVALQQFDEHVAEEAANLGIGMGDARLAKLRGDLLNKQRGIMKELGSKILEQQAQTDRYAAPQAITVGGMGSQGARGKEKPNEYELARIKESLPKKQTAAKKLKELVASMSEKDRGFIENLARRKAAVDPGSWYEFFLRNDDPGKTQQMLQAVNTIVQDSGGRALTKDEASRYAAHIVGDGSPEALVRGAEFAQQLINADEEALHAAFPAQYEEGNLRRGIYRNVDQPHELEGLQDQPDFNKRVISP